MSLVTSLERWPPGLDDMDRAVIWREENKWDEVELINTLPSHREIIGSAGIHKNDNPMTEGLPMRPH